MKKESMILLSALISFSSLQAQEKLYKEKYRPQFHFSPEKNWMNDPNGLVYLDGEYHLFFQYNPFGNRWGHMSWGHAVSTDLLHWRALPIALAEENKVMIFSGSAVVDEKNTSGFATKPGQVPMVAIYTGHYIPDSNNVEDYQQAQYIAYSLDKGRTWKKYTNNPVLDLQKKDFRDPKVFWYAPAKKWIMLTVLPQEHKVLFYSSPNLKQWTYLSEFGPAGDVNDIWECPDLVRVPVKKDSTQYKWVLINSQQTTMQYFIGEFDGVNFRNDNPEGKIYRPDYGPDYYAGVTYNHLPSKHAPVLLGWANNWKYAQDIPTYPWKSAMALPRELSVVNENNEWILLQKPAASLLSLRGKRTEWKDLDVKDLVRLPLKGQQLEIEAEFTPAPENTTAIRLAVGDSNMIVIGYNAAEQKLFVDRSGFNNKSFHPEYTSRSKYEAFLEPQKGKISLHIYFDKSIIEVFANDGRVVMTTEIFPGDNDNMVELSAENHKAKFSFIKVYELRSAW